MRFTQVLVCAAGALGAAAAPASPNAPNATASSYLDLTDGMYTIPIVDDDTLDFSQAVRDWDGLTALSGAASNNTEESVAAALAERRPPGQCDPQFPSRKTLCRSRTVARSEYLRAYAKFLDWIDYGPDQGWIPKKSCKSLLWGSVVVNACSAGGINPTCRGEVVEAMRELDAYCALDKGGDISIKAWKKVYGRHHVRDGDAMDGHKYKLPTGKPPVKDSDP
ncbi:hypothetical protein F5Y00DRAFT_78467 [Daldinia vernicosa]|uniref:uncharacterized protein n=1 Tax=Daldinia vernicosa TaxID=114800 RepID=UPI0020075BDA|nr:uncharacterized protein F5Y00DRAFT_78467 [Daldinia vernicosa]KAI0848938.1 hypothetical protein F5Y00DRAFT_78467 [Daldinia vernicosa]